MLAYRLFVELLFWNTSGLGIAVARVVVTISTVSRPAFQRILVASGYSKGEILLRL
jgi:hypothetical protein